MTATTRILLAASLTAFAAFVPVEIILVVSRTQRTPNQGTSVTRRDVRPFDLPRNDFGRLFDLTFKFMIINEVCYRRLSEPFRLILVHSATSNVERRDRIRRTWARRVAVMFLMGKPADGATQASIDEENSAHRDIVQGNFVDTYRNLSYKHAMGLKYALYYCPEAKFIVKLDDDVFVNIRALDGFLSVLSGGDDVSDKVFCRVNYAERIVRENNRYAVTVEEYAGDGGFYPRFCDGFAVVYPSAAAVKLYARAQRTRFFWIDDRLITGIVLRETNVTHANIRSLVVRRDSVNFFSCDYLFGVARASERLFRLNENAPAGDGRPCFNDKFNVVLNKSLRKG